MSNIIQHAGAHPYWSYNVGKNLPVIVMLHGFRGTHHGLDLIARQLDRFHVIVPDLPGFGIAGALDDEHTVENYVQWVHDFIKSLELAHPPVLLGHSFGTIIAAAYAASYPKTITKLVLVNPIGPHGKRGINTLLTYITLGYYWVGKKLPHNLATRLLSAKFVITIMTLVMTKTKDKQVRAYIYDQHYTHFNSFANPTSVSQAFKTSTTRTVHEFGLQIVVPTLLIAGDKDEITSVAKQQLMAQTFPNARLEVIHGVGHLTHYETPKQVGLLIQAFIKSV